MGEIRGGSGGASPWKAYTPTGSWVSNVTYTGFYRIVGDTMEISGKVVTSGQPTDATLSIELPTSHIIDTTKIHAEAAVTPLGQAMFKDNTAGDRLGIVLYKDTTGIYPIVISAGGFPAYTTRTSPFTWAASDEVHFTAAFPVKAA